MLKVKYGNGRFFRYDNLIKAITGILLGVLLIAFSGKVLSVCCYIIACGLFVYSAVHFIRYFVRSDGFIFKGADLVKAAAAFFFCMLILIFAPIAGNILPVIIGFYLIADGFSYLRYAVAFKNTAKARSYGAMAFGTVSVVCGILCMIFSGFVMEGILKFVGICIAVSSAFELAAFIINQIGFSEGKKKKEKRNGNDSSVVVEKVETSKER